MWVNYVASAPLQNATHQLRFPLVLSLIFMFAAFVIELVRAMTPYFQRDQERWAVVDKAAAEDEAQDQGSVSVEGDAAMFGVKSVDGSVVPKQQHIF